jgi:hypothetical protein
MTGRLPWARFSVTCIAEEVGMRALAAVAVMVLLVGLVGVVLTFLLYILAGLFVCSLIGMTFYGLMSIDRRREERRRQAAGPDWWKNRPGRID